MQQEDGACGRECSDAGGQQRHAGGAGIAIRRRPILVEPQFVDEGGWSRQRRAAFEACVLVAGRPAALRARDHLVNGDQDADREASGE